MSGKYNVFVSVCTQWEKIWVLMKYNVVMLNTIFGVWTITCNCFVYLMCFVILFGVTCFVFGHLCVVGHVDDD